MLVHILRLSALVVVAVATPAAPRDELVARAATGVCAGGLYLAFMPLSVIPSALAYCSSHYPATLTVVSTARIVRTVTDSTGTTTTTKSVSTLASTTASITTTSTSTPTVSSTSITTTTSTSVDISITTQYTATVTSVIQTAGSDPQGRVQRRQAVITAEPYPAKRFPARGSDRDEPELTNDSYEDLKHLKNRRQNHLGLTIAGSLFSSLLKEAGSIISTVCSCIEKPAYTSTTTLTSFTSTLTTTITTRTLTATTTTSTSTSTYTSTIVKTADAVTSIVSTSTSTTVTTSSTTTTVSAAATQTKMVTCTPDDEIRGHGRYGCNYDLHCSSSFTRTTGTASSPVTVSDLQGCINICDNDPNCDAGNYNVLIKSCVLIDSDDGTNFASDEDYISFLYVVESCAPQ